MNYYPFHIGDYKADTFDLSDMQDLAYRRLLDRYYLTEKALPEDVETCARKIRLGEHLEDVRYVLAEFFTLEVGRGWCSKRCEAEIEKVQLIQDAVVVRDDGKQTRLQRFRQERRETFQALQVLGIHAPYNEKMGTLRTLLDAARAQKTGNGNAFDVSGFSNGETAHETAHETTRDASATTIPYPLPITHYPLPKDKKSSLRSPKETSAIPRPEQIDAQTWADWHAVRQAKHAGPVTATVWHGIEREAGKAGIDVQTAVRTCAERGWQGFRADYGGGGPINGARRAPVDPPEPAWRTEQRERVRQAAPYAIAKPFKAVSNHPDDESEGINAHAKAPAR